MENTPWQLMEKKGRDIMKKGRIEASGSGGNPVESDCFCWDVGDCETSEGVREVTEAS